MAPIPRTFRHLAKGLKKGRAQPPKLPCFRGVPDRSVNRRSNIGGPNDKLAFSHGIDLG